MLTLFNMHATTIEREIRGIFRSTDRRWDACRESSTPSFREVSACSDASRRRLFSRHPEGGPTWVSGKPAWPGRTEKAAEARDSSRGEVRRTEGRPSCRTSRRRAEETGRPPRAPEVEDRAPRRRADSAGVHDLRVAESEATPQFGIVGRRRRAGHGAPAVSERAEPRPAHRPRPPSGPARSPIAVDARSSWPWPPGPAPRLGRGPWRPGTGCVWRPWAWRTVGCRPGASRVQATSSWTRV